MLVQDLIKKLEEMPQGARVVVVGQGGVPQDIQTVEVLDDPYAGEFFENVLVC